MFHFGGDEVPHGAWLNSPQCAQYLGKDNITSSDAAMLMTEFVVRVGELVHTAGLDLGGWEDGLMDSILESYNRADFQQDNVYAYAWNNIWEWGGGSRAYVLANSGYNVSYEVIEPIYKLSLTLECYFTMKLMHRK